MKKNYNSSLFFEKLPWKTRRWRILDSAGDCGYNVYKLDRWKVVFGYGLNLYGKQIEYKFWDKIAKSTLGPQ